MSQIQLYTYYRSSCSYRVRIALNLKNIPYETIAVHLVKDGGEQFKDTYLALNPMAEVPSLRHNQRTISQSMAIIEYLEAMWPAPALFPKDPYEAAMVRRICETVNAGIQPIQNLKVLKELTARFSADDTMKAKWAHDWIERGFGALERMLEATAGSFAFGDTPGAADCFIIPQRYNAERFNVNMAQFPLIKRTSDLALQHPEFKRAHPANQPDTPAEQAG